MAEVEELARGQRDRRRGDAGFAGAGAQDRANGGVAVAGEGAAKIEGKLGLEAEVGAAADLEEGESGAALGAAGSADRWPVTDHRFAGGRVEGEAGAVEVESRSSAAAAGSRRGSGAARRS